MINGVAHVCYVVEDLDRAVDFYQNKLGLAEMFDFVHPDGVKFGVYLGAGNRTFVELFVGNHVPANDQQSYKHVCFEVDDIEATVAELKAKGVEVGPIKMGSDNSWQAWLADPDGNRIELHCYTPESRQLGAGEGSCCF